jgi:hypothetical protein
MTYIPSIWGQVQLSEENIRIQQPAHVSSQTNQSEKSNNHATLTELQGSLY